MGRDKGKGRGGGGGRGTGRRLEVANEEEMAMRDRELDEKREQRAKRRGEDEGEEGERKLDAVDEDDDDEDEEEEGAKPAVKTNNPNFLKPAATDAEDPHAGLSRKQKEVLEEQRKREEYMKRHLALQTEEARRDMERLALVRRRREEAAKAREAEGRPPGMSATGLPSDDDDDDDEDDESDEEDEAPKKPAAVAAKPAAPVLSEVQAKKRAAAIETAPAAGSGEVPKLNSMDIKKLNGDALKDALKERGLDIQGQKKDLIKRLTDYEKARA